MADHAIEVRSAMDRVRRAMPRNKDVMLIVDELDRAIAAAATRGKSPKDIADRAEARSKETQAKLRRENGGDRPEFNKGEYTRLFQNIKRARGRGDRAAEDAATAEFIMKFPNASVPEGSVVRVAKKKAKKK